MPAGIPCRMLCSKSRLSLLVWEDAGWKQAGFQLCAHPEEGMRWVVELQALTPANSCWGRRAGGRRNARQSWKGNKEGRTDLHWLGIVAKRPRTSVGLGSCPELTGKLKLVSFFYFIMPIAMPSKYQCWIPLVMWPQCSSAESVGCTSAFMNLLQLAASKGPGFGFFVISLGLHCDGNSTRVTPACSLHS